MILGIGLIRMSAHSLTSEIGIRSKSHDLGGEDIKILRFCNPQKQAQTKIGHCC